MKDRLILQKRMDFDLFKSEICHIYKNLGTYKFISEIVIDDWITYFWEKQWFPESFYTLAMLDYLSDLNNAPYLEKYASYRHLKLAEPIYPSDIILLDVLNKNNNEKQLAIEECSKDECGKYFLKYNIIEKSITDVI